MKKFVFYVLSAVLWGGCLGLVALIWLEYLGGYDQLKGVGKSGKAEFEIHQSNYFGQPLNSNPYEAFSVQHLHPFYMFSLPWSPDAITKANNNFVSLNQAGFRNSFRNNAQMTGIILGGSTAFGAGASSDLTTISSALNKQQSEYNFLNYGVPSWNSHQELVAYIKIPFETDFVISFSGANDFIVAHRYCRRGYEFPPGSPESFEFLAEITDDIRGKRKGKGLFSRLFPRTQKKITKLYNRVTGSDSGEPECRDRILAAADAFIRNQSVIRDLALARGSGYLLALQPHLHFIVQPEKDRHIVEAELRGKFYRYVMESRFCAVADCLDFSQTFKDETPLQVNETPEDPNEAIFVDRVHLTDNGYARIAEFLNAMIRQ